MFVPNISAGMGRKTGWSRKGSTLKSGYEKTLLVGIKNVKNCKRKKMITNIMFAPFGLINIDSKSNDDQRKCLGIYATYYSILYIACLS